MRFWTIALAHSWVGAALAIACSTPTEPLGPGNGLARPDDGAGATADGGAGAGGGGDDAGLTGGRLDAGAPSGGRTDAGPPERDAAAAPMDGGSTPMTWDLESARQASERAVCARLESCGLSVLGDRVEACAERRIAEGAEPLETAAGLITPGSAALAPLVAAGRIRLDTEALEACLAASAACTARPLSCLRLVGTVAAGEACFLDDECAAGFCDAPLGRCGHCVAPRAPGASCERGAQCGEGARCLHGRCLLRVEVGTGEACDDPRADPAAPWRFAVCGGLDVCVDGRCQAGVVEGACRQDAECLMSLCAEGRCRRPRRRTLGDACEAAAFDACEEGACVLGRCARLPAAGEACPTGLCDDDAWCPSPAPPPDITPERVCQARVEEGEACAPGRCAPGLVCRPRSREGLPVCTPLVPPAGCL